MSDGHAEREAIPEDTPDKEREIHDEHRAVEPARPLVSGLRGRIRARSPSCERRGPAVTHVATVSCSGSSLLASRAREQGP